MGTDWFFNSDKSGKSVDDKSRNGIANFYWLVSRGTRNFPAVKKLIAISALRGKFRIVLFNNDREYYIFRLFVNNNFESFFTVR